MNLVQRKNGYQTLYFVEVHIQQADTVHIPLNVWKLILFQLAYV